MARGDDTRVQGRELDKVHDQMLEVQKRLKKVRERLDGILSDDLLGDIDEVADQFDSCCDDVQGVYTKLDDVADELDLDERNDEKAKGELESELKAAQERIEELESEIDDHDAEED